MKCQIINYSDDQNLVPNFNGVALQGECKGNRLCHIIGPNVCSDVI